MLHLEEYMARYNVIAKRDLNEWAVGSPIFVKKYQIVNDSITDAAILQIKMQNLSKQIISTTFVNIICYDAAKDFLYEESDILYNVGQIQPQIEFGDKQPIILKNIKTYSVSIVVSKVVFADGLVWRNEDKKEKKLNRIRGSPWAFMARAPLLIYSKPKP